MIKMSNSIIGESFENEILDVTSCRYVGNSYFKNCEIIINMDDDFRLHGFGNVVFDNCKIRYIANGNEKSQLPLSLISNFNEPVKFINTKVNLKGERIYCSGYGASGSLSVKDTRVSYYLSKFFNGCTLNNEPIKSDDVTKSNKEDIDFADRLESQLPVFKKEKKNYGSMFGNNTSNPISDDWNNKRDMEINDYKERYAKLNAIEKATDVDMGFQKGMLDVEFGRFIMVRNPDDPKYSSYDEGVLYAMNKKNKLIQSMFSDFDNIDRFNNEKKM